MNVQEIIDFYKDHSIGETQELFSISRYKLLKLLKDNNVNIHTSAENNFLNNKKREDKCLENLLAKITKEDFQNFYINNGRDETIKHFNISLRDYKKLIKLFNITPLTATEVKKLKYKKLYGDSSIGFKQEAFKRVSNIDYEKTQQKKNKTNLEKYGSISPLGNKEVQNKAKETLIKNYNVTNPSKSQIILDKIKNTKINKYGGYGWDSDLIRQKYQEKMIERYGVEWGCQTEQCINANHSKDSKPNLIFEEKLKNNNIEYEREFCLDSFKYDFKVSNYLIEINPSYTHNITIPYRNNDKLRIDKNYHQIKSETARKYDYTCIHIFDWDDEEKIIAFLKPKNKIYARKCEIRNLNKEEEILFLNTYHLQGYIKSEICFGLFYNNSLVSLMSFGIPRYNKNYEWELLRYCVKDNIIGGAEKLFTYFLTNHKPKNIISYCDLSKFNGEVYNKLNFKLLNKNIRPSKHWFNLKTGKHITDNLLRQRGYDQLFGTNYGKGISNEQLMLENNFLEIFDSGQATYVYENGDN